MTNLALRRLGGPVGEALAFPFWLVQMTAFIGRCWLPSRSRSRLAPGGRARSLVPRPLGLAVVAMATNSQMHDRSNLLVAIALPTLFTWASRVRAG